MRETGRTNDLPSGGFARVWGSLALKTSCLSQFLNYYHIKRNYHKYNDYVTEEIGLRRLHSEPRDKEEEVAGVPEFAGVTKWFRGSCLADSCEFCQSPNSATPELL